MGQKKLLRFAQIKTFSNVLEYPSDMSGKWKDQFKNEQPIVLELACGRGEYTVGLSKLFPEQNFIGVDIKGNRMYLGAKTAIDQSLTNAAFLRTQIEMIADYFESGEVKEIWITFPDPQLRTSKAKKRLTHPRFLRLYQRILAPGGIIHLKTDSPALYQFTLTVIKEYGLTLVTQNEDVYKEKDVDPRLLIKTHYEGLDIAQSNKIFYLSFTLPNEIPDKDEWLQELLKQTEQSVG
jgi:tRNA (guanine-N7-)-methyltransferase